jgi:hypothetical protein
MDKGEGPNDHLAMSPGSWTWSVPKNIPELNIHSLTIAFFVDKWPKNAKNYHF